MLTDVDIFAKYRKISNFMKIRLVRAKLIHVDDTRTGRH